MYRVLGIYDFYLHSYAPKTFGRYIQHEHEGYLYWIESFSTGSPFYIAF